MPRLRSFQTRILGEGRIEPARSLPRAARAVRIGVHEEKHPFRGGSLGGYRARLSASLRLWAPRRQPGFRGRRVWERITPALVIAPDRPDWCADSIAFQVMAAGESGP